MATILSIKTTVNDQIRTIVTVGGILKTNHANIEDAILNEVRDRGALPAATTGALASISALADTRWAIVKNVGVFRALQTGASPNGTTTFASADSGWLWELYFSSAIAENAPDSASTDQPLDYVLDEGLAIWKVKVKPDGTYNLKIGTTDGGEELSSATPLTADEWNTFNFDVDADGGPITIYFTGVTEQTTFAIYRVQLPL